jgi:hypothetical protein
MYETIFEKTPNFGWSAKEVEPVSPTLAWLGPCFVSCLPPHVILSVTMSYFGHNEDMHVFGPYDAFSSSDVLEMVN